MVYRYDADYNGEVVAEAKAPHLNSVPGAALPGLGHPRAGAGAVREELDPADLRRRLHAGPAAAAGRPGRRAAARPDVLDAAQRLADPHRVPEEHGRPGLDVDLAAARGQALGSHRVPPLQRPARAALRHPRRRGVPRLHAVAAAGGPRRPGRGPPGAAGPLHPGVADRGHARRGPALAETLLGSPTSSTSLPPTASPSTCRAHGTAAVRSFRGAGRRRIAALGGGPRRGRRRHRRAAPDRRRSSACRSSSRAVGWSCRCRRASTSSGSGGEAVRDIDWGGDPRNKAIAAREGRRGPASSPASPSSGGGRSSAAGPSRGLTQELAEVA